MNPLLFKLLEMLEKTRVDSREAFIALSSVNSPESLKMASAFDKFSDFNNFNTSKINVCYVFETFMQIVSVFGYNPNFDTATPMVGNFSKSCVKHLKYPKDLEGYLMKTKMNAGSSSGSADFCFEQNSQIIPISCKYFTNEKTITLYDLEKMYVDLCEVQGSSCREQLMGLWVNDSTEVLKKIQRSSKVVAGMIHSVTGIDDMHVYMNRFLADLRLYGLKGIIEKFGVAKPKFHLRIHQVAVRNRIIDCFKQTPAVVDASVARSGKTYTSFGVAVKINARNVLFISSVADDTYPTVDAIANGYAEFDKYAFTRVRSSRDFKCIDFTQKNIVYVSMAMCKTADRMKRLAEVMGNFDMVINDEAHFSSSTSRAIEFIDAISSLKANVIHMSATPEKTISMFNIKNVIMYNLTDRFEYATNTRAYALKNGVSKIELGEYNLDKEKTCYSNMPAFCFVTFSIKKAVRSIKRAFSYTRLFNVEDSHFVNRDSVVEFLQFFSDSNYTVGQKHTPIMQQVLKTAGPRDVRHIVWYLPPKNIDAISSALIELFKVHLPDYHGVAVNSFCDVADRKTMIETAYTNALKLGKKRVIFLANTMLSMSHSDPDLDVVCMFNDTKSSDMYYQRAFRCLTEDSARGKKYGFVVDTSDSSEMYNFVCQQGPAEMTTTKKFEYVIENNLACFTQNNITQHFEKWRRVYSRTNYTMCVEAFRSEVSRVSGFPEQKRLAELFKNTKVKRTRKRGSSGAQKRRIRLGLNNPVTAPEAVPVKKPMQKTPEFKFETVIADMIVVLVVLDYELASKIGSFLEFLESVSTEVIADFEEKAKAMWFEKNTHDAFPLILSLFKEAQNRGIIFDEVYSEIVENVKNVKKSPGLLIDLVSTYLIPTDAERSKSGEVRTPILLIEELLDQMENDYADRTGSCLFSDPELKFFDSCAGFGNFHAVIYKRLMQGLRECFESPTKRSKHIIENMLYMAEYSKFNYNILRFAFGETANIVCGDSLVLDTEKEWSVDKFDIITINPPYNAIEKCKKTGKEKKITPWPKFIEYSLDHLKPKGWMLTLNPTGWLKTTKTFAGIRDRLLNTSISYVNIHDNISAEQIIDGKIPLTLLILQNTASGNSPLDKKTFIRSEIEQKRVYSDSYVDFTDFKTQPVYPAFNSVFNKMKIAQKKKSVTCYDLRSGTSKVIKMEAQSVPIDADWRDMLAVTTITERSGVQVKEIAKWHDSGFERTPKLIFGNKYSYHGCFIDFKGSFGVAPGGRWYGLKPNDSEFKSLKNVVRFVSSVWGQIIAHLTKYSQGMLSTESFALVADYGDIDYDDLDVMADFFNLNEHETEEVKRVAAILKK